MAKIDSIISALNLQDLFNQPEKLKELFETLLNALLQEEATNYIQAKNHERTEERRGYRNGTKPRTLNTRVGKLDLSVPQVRDCPDGPYEPSIWNKWQRSEQALLVTCAEMYQLGVSTRNVGKVLEKMGGYNLSAGQISRITAQLDEKLQTFRERKLLLTSYPFLLLDARYENIRESGQVVSKAFLIAIGINDQGKREVLDWRVADSENTETWSDVLRSLKDRGLRGVRLVVSDAHKGIRSAVARHLQGSGWQRCRVHYKRNILNRVGWKMRKKLSQELNIVFMPEDRTECLRRGEEMVRRWSKQLPWLKQIMNPEELESCLTVCNLPSGHRYRLRSTNMLERLMQELKRRSKPVRIFPNAASCERLLGMNLLETHERWQTEARPFLCMGYLENSNYPEIASESGKLA
jgi:transposase-like protein